LISDRAAKAFGDDPIYDRKNLVHVSYASDFSKVTFKWWNSSEDCEVVLEGFSKQIKF
jgi:hypothetical protein